MSLHSFSIYICIAGDKTQMQVEWACPNPQPIPGFPGPTTQPYCPNLLGMQSQFVLYKVIINKNDHEWACQNMNVNMTRNPKYP
jgi:hypothetical protein